MATTQRSTLFCLFVFILSLCSLSQAHRPFPEIACLNKIENGCLFEVRKPSFRKYELHFLGPITDYGYECGALKDKLFQQITTAEVLMQILPGTIQVKKISSVTKFIDPVPQAHCSFVAESMSNQITLISESKTYNRNKLSEEEFLKICDTAFTKYDKTLGNFASAIYLTDHDYQNGYQTCEVTSMHLEIK